MSMKCSSGAPSFGHRKGEKFTGVIGLILFAAPKCIQQTYMNIKNKQLNETCSRKHDLNYWTSIYIERGRVNYTW